jgi:hypothetical protein
VARRTLAFGLLLGCIGCIGCQDGYPIPATRCDRWCDAGQLTFCDGYDPADCVLTCSQRYGDTDECGSELEELIACVKRTPAQELVCRYGLDVPPCSDENMGFIECGTQVQIRNGNAH